MFSASNDKEQDKAEQLYKQYRSTMLYIAKGILTEKSAAEDAVSEAFIKILKNLDKFYEMDCYKTRALIVIITRNTAIDLLRSQNRIKPLSYEECLDYTDKDESVFDEVSAKNAYEKLTLYIQKLKPNYSDILFLKGIYGYSTDEIAGMLGITKENVSVRLNRARNALKEQLQKENEAYE